MSNAQPSNDSEYIDPCVAQFLSRHGIDKEDGFSVLDTIVQTNSKESDAEMADNSRTIVSPVKPGQPSSQADDVESTTSTTSPPPLVQTPAQGKEDSTILPKRRESVDTMRELRSVANAISVSISRSNLLREKLKEATRFLGLGFVSGIIALCLSVITTSVHSVVFFAALFTLVLGLISTYRSTMIMTKLGRIAKI